MNVDDARWRDKLLLISLYICEGLPFAVVVAMPIVYLKNCGLDNSYITLFTNLVAVPWALKALWAPKIDRSSSKRRTQIVTTQSLCALLCAALALGNFYHLAPQLMMVIFGLLGLVSATQELSVDALYLSMFDEPAQAKFMWIRNTAFRIAYLLGAGILISVAGYLSENYLGGTAALGGWTAAFAICSALLAVATIYNSFGIRAGELRQAKSSREVTEAGGSFKEATASFFRLDGIYRIMVYTLLFRLGDAFLGNMAQPFLLDPVGRGGLGMQTSLVGFIYGTCGAISLLIGGICGGLLVARFGARKLLVPFSLLQSISILAYYGLSICKPGTNWVCGVNAFEQFAFGLTTACYSIVLLMAINKKHLAAHFAFISSVMSAGIMIPGMVSGGLTDRFGYSNFFLLSFLFSLLGPTVVAILPKHTILDKPALKADIHMVSELSASEVLVEDITVVR